jgi:hypothetical protein
MINNTAARLAQSVECWSNKPLVTGSIPVVSIIFDYELILFAENSFFLFQNSR